MGLEVRQVCGTYNFSKRQRVAGRRDLFGTPEQIPYAWREDEEDEGNW